MRWTITDEGPGFDVQSRMRAAESEEVSLLSSGRGIIMMRAFMDAVYYEEGGRRVVMEMLRNTEDGVCRLYSGPSEREIEDLLKHQESLQLDQGSNLDETSNFTFDARFDAFLDELIRNGENDLVEDDPEWKARRKFERVAYPAGVQVTESSGATYEAYARDVSRGGMSFVSERLPESADIEVLLPVRDESIALHGRIVRRTRLSSNVLDVGVQFIRDTDKA